ncbi:MAG: hypothetical protein E7235_02675 [Lachnospiraceae bacterium]|nr:hypothetical protein [Lachnospiraceae bacterium]
MKFLNKLGALALAGVMALSLAACSSAPAEKISITNENIETVLKDTKNRLTKLNEVSAEMSVSVGLGSAGSASTGVTKAYIKDMKDPVLKEIIVKTSQDGVEAEDALEVYIKEESGKYLLYTIYEGEWYKQEIESYYVGYLFNQYYITENAVKLLDNIENAKVDSTENGLTKVTCEVPTANVFSLADGTGAFSYLFESLNQAFFNVAEPVKANMWLDETGMLVKYEIDYTAALQDVLNTIYGSYGASLSGMLEVSDYTITVEMADFDALDGFDLPENVKNAQEFANLEDGVITIDE